MREYLNKIVVVSGGASGIGKGIVNAFSKEGAKVIFADIHEENGWNTQEEIKKETNNPHVDFFKADFSIEEDIKKFSDFIINKYDKVDILINNIGVNIKSGRLTDVELDVYEKVFKINVLSSITLTKLLLPSMMKERKGSIINISSTMSLGTKNDLAYSASKGYINTMTKSLALDYAKDQIRFNAIAPGIIETPATQPWILQQKDPAESKGVPMGKVGKPEDIANAALFLSSEKASYITGHILVVDGGLTVGE